MADSEDVPLPLDFIATRPTKPEVHIGDGVYASYDGFQIWLRVDRYGQSERVALDPTVFPQLLRFARTIWTGI